MPSPDRVTLTEKFLDLRAIERCKILSKKLILFFLAKSHCTDSDLTCFTREYFICQEKLCTACYQDTLEWTTSIHQLSQTFSVVSNCLQIFIEGIEEKHCILRVLNLCNVLICLGIIEWHPNQGLTLSFETT